MIVKGGAVLHGMFPPVAEEGIWMYGMSNTFPFLAHRRKTRDGSGIGGSHRTKLMDEEL
jgi:hypothetical protein